MLKAVLASPENGISSFEQVLREASGAPTFDELFADWVVANALDDSSAGDGRYGHQASAPTMTMESTHRDFPVHESGSVHQYGTDYIALVPAGQPLKIEFSGNVKVPVVPNRPYQGRYQWWSNRGDMSNMTLTREFDLTGLDKATLEYALWYELEDGWDYGYVEVSTDNGSLWTLLRTKHSTTYNPMGNAFGPGYTGFSGHPAGATSRLKAQWIRERIDLTPYVGQRILVRFEVITDDAMNLPGMCIDDISIPELDFRDDAESDAAGWRAEGFVRMDNELAQEFIVQVIQTGEQPRIERLRLDDQRRGSLILGGAERAILAISGCTRHTTEAASYSYTITPIKSEPE